MFSLHSFIVLSLWLPDLRNLSLVERQSHQNMFRVFDKVDEHLPTWQLLNCIFIVNLVSPRKLTTFPMQQVVDSINIRYWWRKKALSSQMSIHLFSVSVRFWTWPCGWWVWVPSLYCVFPQNMLSVLIYQIVNTTGRFRITYLIDPGMSQFYLSNISSGQEERRHGWLLWKQPLSYTQSCCGNKVLFSTKKHVWGSWTYLLVT